MPMYDAIPLSRVRGYFQERHWPAVLLENLLRSAVEDGKMTIAGDRVRHGGHRAVWTPRHQQKLQVFLAPLKETPPIVDLRLLPGKREDYALVEGLLIWEKYLVNLTPDLLIYFAYLNHIVQTLHERFSGKLFAIQELKTLFQFTRKYAIPLLEYLDKAGCTQRQEEGRLWIAREPPIISCGWTPPS